MFELKIPSVGNKTFHPENAIDFEDWCAKNCEAPFQMVDMYTIRFMSHDDALEFSEKWLDGVPVIEMV
jgi:hypothetical protein